MEPTDINEQTTDSMDVVNNMMKYVMVPISAHGSDSTSINGLLTDKYEPSYIFNVLNRGCECIDLRYIIENPNNGIKDMAIIRATNLLINIINNKTVVNAQDTLREILLSADKFSYNYDYNGDSYVLPSTYIESLGEQLLPKVDYRLSNHTDKLITAIGYINLGLYINILEYIVERP